jgi:hypothetical protein
MSENQQPKNDLLEEAVQAFQRMTVPDRPPDAEVLAQLGSPQLDTVPPIRVSSPSRRRYLMRVLVPAAAAASILLGGLGWFLFNSTTSVALADVIKAAEKHKLVKYKQTQTTEDKEQNLTASTDSVAYADLKAPRFRSETKILTFNGAIESVSVQITDGRKSRRLSTITEMAVPDAEKDPDKAKALAMYPHTLPRKEAHLSRSEDGQDPKKKPQPFLENLRELEKHKDAVVTKDKLGGREAVKYYIEDGKKTTKLWVDARTKLPVRLEHEILDQTPNIPLNKWVYTDFEWDPELKGFKSMDELFDTNPPEGYKVEDKTKDAEKR